MIEDAHQYSPAKASDTIIVSNPENHQEHPRNKRHVGAMIGSLLTLAIVSFGAIIGLSTLNSSKDIRSKATNTGPVLALSPATTTATVNQTISIGMTLNTNDDTVSAAELHLTYDPTAIEIVSFTPGSKLPVVLSPETHANGTISVALGVQPTAPFKGADIIGTWSVKILAAKTSSIAFATTTQVASLGKTTNSLAGSTGSSITGSTTAVTPSPTPSAVVGDLDGNGSVNIVDYTLFMNYWWTSNPKADFNNDTKINAIDYTIFMNAWGGH
jgi:hypothetical protein